MRGIHFGHAAGADWRRALDQALENLGQAGGQATLGFCYLTEAVGGEAAAVLRRLRERTDVPHWIGTVGTGICSDGVEYFDTPAAVVLTLTLPESGFRVFTTAKADLSDLDLRLKKWIDESTPRFGVVHGDPRNPDLEAMTARLSARLGGAFLVGGLSSARLSHFQIADGVAASGLSGVLFGGDLAICTRLSQGCTPIGPRHLVTRAEGNVVFTLDGRPAVEVFAEDIAALGEIGAAALAGLVHVAIPVTGSDTGDYVVRNLMGIDPDVGAMAVGELLEDVDQIMFCKRDAASAETDLLRMLGEINKGLKVKPKGGIYFSCMARGPNLFGPDSRELKIIQENIGSLPLAGFFGNGEICNDRLYGYTGVLTLFV